MGEQRVCVGAEDQAGVALAYCAHEGHILAEVCILRCADFLHLAARLNPHEPFGHRHDSPIADQLKHGCLRSCQQTGGRERAGDVVRKAQQGRTHLRHIVSRMTCARLVCYQLAPRKREIAMVFQSYAVFPHLTVFENVAFGLRMRKRPNEEVKRRVDRAAEMLQLGPYLQRFPAQLGQPLRERGDRRAVLVVAGARVAVGIPVPAQADGAH